MARRKMRDSEIGMWFSLGVIVLGLFLKEDPILLLVFGGIIGIVFFFYRSTKNK